MVTSERLGSGMSRAAKRSRQHCGGIRVAVLRLDRHRVAVGVAADVADDERVGVEGERGRRTGGCRRARACAACCSPASARSKRGTTRTSASSSGEAGLVPWLDGVDEVDDDRRGAELAPEPADRQHQVVGLLVPAVAVLGDASNEQPAHRRSYRRAGAGGAPYGRPPMVTRVLDVRSAAAAAVKATAATGRPGAAPPPGVVFLIYHRVGGAPAPRSTCPRRCSTSRWRGSRAPGGGEHRRRARRRSSGARRPAHDPVVVTFDDGTADLVEIALPILVHAIGCRPCSTWPPTSSSTRGRSRNDGAPLSWAAVRDAVSTGLVTDRVAHRHPRPARPPRPGGGGGRAGPVARLIEERAGVAAARLRLPEGGRRVAGRSRSSSAAGSGRPRWAAAGPTRTARTDRHRLARSAIQRSDGMRYFERKARGGMALEDRLRRAVNRSAVRVGVVVTGAGDATAASPAAARR